MKLKNAMICLDCEEVFEQEIVYFLDQKVAIEYCPSCRSFTIVRPSRTMAQIAERKDCECMYKDKCNLREACKTTGNPSQPPLKLRGGMVGL